MLYLTDSKPSLQALDNGRVVPSNVVEYLERVPDVADWLPIGSLLRKEEAVEEDDYIFSPCSYENSEEWLFQSQDENAHEENVDNVDSDELNEEDVESDDSDDFDDAHDDHGDSEKYEDGHVGSDKNLRN
jgi:hypothetical protein